MQPSALGQHIIIAITMPSKNPGLKDELPKFSQMKLLYPGYYLHGGTFRDKDLYQLLGTNASHALDKVHNTAPMRMSVALNRYNGRHAIGPQPVFLSKRGRDSFTGPNGQEYIFSNTAFGPFMASKYGDPVAVKPDKRHPELTMEAFTGKQGIVRLVSYRRKHPSGHMGLWDCDHFFQSRDWTMDTHIIAVEFWETPGIYTYN
ncbi:hypothetical protein CAPTEDRAFT_201269 [Capitella teleta]|uniref:Uncharacterized protein n=1 Tax=Capitella teleta TaxID=283909 RepID=R7UQG8_CAPTE|nr:hypothetical protein CAPTEDRAFT_201269 [Capitella teleta]|eukprot:ELU06172.1 hypothetical protein CAPTEDRAFT_201269 [Capitella teleta]